MRIDGKIASMNSQRNHSQVHSRKNNHSKGDNNNSINSKGIIMEAIAMDKAIIIIIIITLNHSSNSNNLETLQITMDNNSSRNSNNTNKDNPKDTNHKGNISNILLLHKLLRGLSRTTTTLIISRNMNDHISLRFLRKTSIITLI